MNIELVIDSAPSEVSIALLKDGLITELHKEKNNKDFAVGDIYLGKVKKVIPSLNAAFVDVGYDKDAFLHYLDLGPQFSSATKFLKQTTSNPKFDAELNNFTIEPDINKDGKIKEQLSQGQAILVQIAKEPISTKGPRLTSEITIPGRFLVLVPFSNKISISQRIVSSEERERLKRLVKSIKPDNFGIIIRTVAEGKKVADLDLDLRDSLERWKQLTGKLYNMQPVKRVLGELNKTSTILRDILSKKFSSIHVNDADMAGEIKNYLSTIAADQVDIVKLYKGKESIFDFFEINRQIKASFGKHVSLKSGAYLIVEHTEAMHVIDVNSGNRKASTKSQEESALETNLECAKEIARILQLRDMGGIIVVDFIDMYERENQKILYEKFKEYLREDRAKHNILPPSKFGVVEITRQRVKPETDIKTTEVCPVCNGTGEAEATVLIIDEIENNLRYIAEDLNEKSVTLRVHPFIEAFLTKGIFTSVRKRWSKKYKIKLKVEAQSTYHFLEYHFFNPREEGIMT
ncbi:MAG: Rne/Rng family ribonuclease [Luteibaculaceae bacterium]